MHSIMKTAEKICSNKRFNYKHCDERTDYENKKE